MFCTWYYGIRSLHPLLDFYAHLHSYKTRKLYTSCIKIENVLCCLLTPKNCLSHKAARSKILVLENWKNRLPSQTFQLTERLCANKISQKIWAGTLEKNIMKKAFQKKYFQRKISSVQTPIPTLALLEKSPASDCIGQVFNFVFFSYG